MRAASLTAWPSTGKTLAWFSSGALLAFLVSWLGTDVLRLQPDFYYLVYFTIMLTFLAAFLGRIGVDWRRVLRARLAWSVVLGTVVAVFAIQNVWRDPATPRPEGVRLGFEVIWRGLLYGVVDALILYVFPALIALLLLRGNRVGIRRMVAFGALTLLLVVTITGSYHLGYDQFRDERLGEPEIGAVLNSAPTVLTGNAAGAVVAHAAVHVAAVIHSYEGESYLPPMPKGYEPRATGAAAVLTAVGWLLLTAVIWWRGGAWLLGRPRGKGGSNDHNS